jgi:trk system potassium uptake protein TrkA
MRIAIAGAGNVGRAIARELLENGHHVLLDRSRSKGAQDGFCSQRPSGY